MLADLGCFAVGACLLVCRTGGLEAGIALHSVNNVLLFAAVIGFGGWQEAFVDTDTTSTPAAFAVSALAEVAAVALLWGQARRRGIGHRYHPAGMRTGERPRPVSAGFVAVHVP